MPIPTILATTSIEIKINSSRAFHIANFKNRPTIYCLHLVTMTKNGHGLLVFVTFLIYF